MDIGGGGVRFLLVGGLFYSRTLFLPGACSNAGPAVPTAATACPAGNVRNATAATAANPAAQASIAEYPSLAMAAPPASEATNCAANDTSIIRAAAPVRSCSRTRSINSVLTPGSDIH